jgi:hypothetical protein
MPATTTSFTDQTSVLNEKPVKHVPPKRGSNQCANSPRPVFVPRGQSQSHSADLELIKSAGRQACLKRRGQERSQAQTPPNVGRPRANLGFLTASPARASRAVRMKGIFAGSAEETANIEAERRSDSGKDESQVIANSDVGSEDDDFQDAVLAVIADRENDDVEGCDGDRDVVKEQKRADSVCSELKSPVTSFKKGEGRAKLAVPTGPRNSVHSSRRSPLRTVRLPLSRENIAKLDAGRAPTDLARLPPLPSTTNSRATSARGPGQTNRIPMRNKTTASLSGMSPMRTLIAPPRRNPARIAKTMVKQSSAPSTLQIATSAFSVSSSSSSSSSTPAWTDDDVFLRRHPSTRRSRHSRSVGTTGGKNQHAKKQARGEVMQLEGERSGTIAETTASSMVRTGLEFDLALDMSAIATRNKRKVRTRFQGPGAGERLEQAESSPLSSPQQLASLRSVTET